MVKITLSHIFTSILLVTKAMAGTYGGGALRGQVQKLEKYNGNKPQTEFTVEKPPIEREEVYTRTIVRPVSYSFISASVQPTFHKVQHLSTSYKSDRPSGDEGDKENRDPHISENKKSMSVTLGRRTVLPGNFIALYADDNNQDISPPINSFLDLPGKPGDPIRLTQKAISSRHKSPDEESVASSSHFLIENHDDSNNTPKSKYSESVLTNDEYRTFPKSIETDDRYQSAPSYDSSISKNYGEYRSETDEAESKRPFRQENTQRSSSSTAKLSDPKVKFNTYGSQHSRAPSYAVKSRSKPVLEESDEEENYPPSAKLYSRHGKTKYEKENLPNKWERYEPEQEESEPLIDFEYVPKQNKKPAKREEYYQPEIENDQRISASKHDGGSEGKTQGGGSESEERHHSKHEDKGEKGYKKDEKHEKSAKGHHDKEKHAGEYKEEKGHEDKQQKEDKYYGEHHKGEKGEKAKKFGEGKKHKKGHSTTGEHNIVKKNEYIKSTKFYDEDHDGGEKEERGEFHGHHKEEEGGKKEGGYAKKGYHKEDNSKEGHHDKGHIEEDHAGHEHDEGHESHYGHEESYGGKKGGKSHKKWGKDH